ncbi:hypothetical protein [Chthonomonas calidirosea]|uniref:hypothetical protein n=1 Tax=Chthonomonas calidirosea TaxID=454171 RepID=UPI0012E34A04|nr:hypothetical protein [Chthonomonas calidirosea]
MRVRTAIGMGSLLVVLAGCQSVNTAPANSGSASRGNTPDAFAGTNVATSPAAPSEEKKPTLSQALAEAPMDDPSLKPLVQKYAQAEAALKAHPNDANAKKAYVNAAYNYAHTIEYVSDKLEPVIKYRAALLLYRKALAVDPNNAPCEREKDQIEAIYRTMPGGVPQE